MAVRLKGWRYALFIGGLVSSISFAMYFSAIRPMLNPEPYKKIRQESIQKLQPRLE